MILRKPYAFLIKYFKVINLVLAFLAGYSTYRFVQIISFFGDYVGSNYSGSYYQGFYTNYINLTFYATIFLILFGIGGILLLFINRKKPTKAYIFSGVYYILYFIFLLYIKNVMITLETNVITAELARIYRDLTIIAVIPQFAFILLFIIRGFGYNIDKFNFKQDIKELEILDTDNEEFELTFKQDGVKVKRTAHRFIREFIYYVKENKFFFTIISIVVIIVLGFVIYKSFPNGVSRFRQGDYFESLGLSYKLQDSIITNLNYNGVKIDKNNYYIVVKLYIENNSKDKVSLDYNRFRLEINNRYLYPVTDKSVYFVDYAKSYNGAQIAGNSKNTYSLIYKIGEKEVKKNYKIKIDGGLTLSKNDLVGKYHYVTINPVVVDNVSVEGVYKLDDTISFINSNLKNSSLKLSNVEYTNTYTYNYEDCISVDKCSSYVNQIKVNSLKSNTTLIVFDYEFTLDDTIPYYTRTTTINNFINSFFNIRYKNGDDYVYTTVSNVTPNNLKGKIVLEATNKILKSDDIAISIIIRNKEYLINLK